MVKYIKAIDIVNKTKMTRLNLNFPVFFPGATVFEVIKAFEDASGLKIPTKLTGRRQGDVPASYASCDLIEKELGWKAKLTLYDMCRFE